MLHEGLVKHVLNCESRKVLLVVSENKNTEHEIRIIESWNRIIGPFKMTQSKHEKERKNLKKVKFDWTCYGTVVYKVSFFSFMPQLFIRCNIFLHTICNDTSSYLFILSCSITIYTVNKFQHENGLGIATVC